MTTPTTKTSNSQMHNDIMAAGSRERLPMLATRDMLILAKPTTTIEEAVPEHTIVETYKNTTPEKRAYFDAEVEAIHMILSGIGDEIYSIVDACNTAKETWIAIERLQQGESLNKQDVKTNLFWEFGKFTLRDGESIESYYQEWSRFVTVVKKIADLDKESYHKLFDILKQYQNDVNEIRAEKLARNANPLALVAATQQYPDTHYQAPKPHKPYTPSSKLTPSTRSHALTKNRAKEIAKPIIPPSESASEEDEDSDPEQAQRDKDMHKNLALIAKYIKNIYKHTNNNLEASSNTKNKNMDTSPRNRNDS
ncbi:hypothetical protein Tco_0687535 [Tanacetum coccineum]